MEYFTQYISPLGILTLRASKQGLTALSLAQEAVTGEYLPEHPILQKASSWLSDYFSGNPREVDFPLASEGTAFRQLVWRILLEIPWGGRCTYGGIAREIEKRTGKGMSAQAVGQAVGANPLWIVVPCHRCVGAKGQLTGYAGGMEVKAWLLRHEGWNISQNKID